MKENDVKGENKNKIFSVLCAVREPKAQMSVCLNFYHTIFNGDSPYNSVFSSVIMFGRERDFLNTPMKVCPNIVAC